LGLPNQFLLSDLLRHRVRCDQGIDHGTGVLAWMHPPVHRLLGWATKPSVLRLSRNVWRLDQLRGIGDHEVFVKGESSFSEQAVIDRLPTLLDADVLDENGIKLASIVDLLFAPKTGKIFYYLLARTDPRIPGTSRWRLSIDRIYDQQPGMVSTSLKSIDDLPLIRSSVREDFLRKSRDLKDQLQGFTDQASSKLEGWLEEPPWDESINPYSKNEYETQDREYDDWLDSDNESNDSNISNKSFNTDNDPWI